jgi:hypothetical protein
MSNDHLIPRSVLLFSGPVDLGSNAFRSRVVVIKRLRFGNESVDFDFAPIPSQTGRPPQLAEVTVAE